MGSFLNLILWYSVKRKFNFIGKNSFIEWPFKLHGEKYIRIGNNFRSFSGLRLEAYDSHLNNYYKPRIHIGDNVSINYDCHIGCINHVFIGNNVLMASKIFITDHYHGNISADALDTPPSFRQLVSKGPIIIEDNVWIGEGVAIMPGVTVGRNSIIGANSVVTKSIAANSVVGGIPAKVIKTLTKESF